jgi:hypothetical protein
LRDFVLPVFTSYKGLEVITLRGKQTQIKLTFSGQACAIAITAKGFGDAADETYFTQM